MVRNEYNFLQSIGEGLVIPGSEKWRKTHKENVMVKWEYKTTHLVTGDEALEKLGAEGWELCGILPNSKAYFKRSVKNARGSFIAGPVITVNISDAEKEKLKGSKNARDPFVKREIIIGNKKNLLSQFRAMVLELIEAGDTIPSEVKHKAYNLIDSCYDKDGELIE